MLVMHAKYLCFLIFLEFAQVSENMETKKKCNSPLVAHFNDFIMWEGPAVGINFSEWDLFSELNIFPLFRKLERI